jgi:hypothetical protein
MSLALPPTTSPENHPCDRLDPTLMSQAFHRWQPITQMNAQNEIAIREIFWFDLLMKSPAFSFIGTRAALAAYLIEKDSADWSCVNYLIFERGPGSSSDPATRHWYVWRR